MPGDEARYYGTTLHITLEYVSTTPQFTSQGFSLSTLESVCIRRGSRNGLDIDRLELYNMHILNAFMYSQSSYRPISLTLKLRGGANFPNLQWVRELEMQTGNGN